MTTAASLLVRGRIATLTGDQGFGWAEAVAIADGRVIAAGSREDLEPLIGPRTRRFELAPDEAALPALADAHLHLLDVALADGRVDLAGLPWPEALERIAAAHRALGDPDAWLEGDGWDVDAWGSWPDAGDLEAVAPGRRAVLWAHDRHALWASETALIEAGLSASSADPPGGMIRRRPDGSPSGILHETGAALVLRLIRPPTVERRVEALRRLLPSLLAAGLAAVHDPGPISPEAGLAALEAYATLDAAGDLPIEVHASVRRESLGAAIHARLRSGDPLAADLAPEAVHARVGWLKLFADGTMGSRTAAMLEPFERGPDGSVDGGRGVFQVPPEELARLVAEAAAAGVSSQVHAIGDAAVRAALDALRPSDGPLRPRIEHAQLVDPADLPRFAALGVVASVQPCHLGTDAATARDAWGERAERAYPYRSLVEAGAVLAFGTDAPIEPWDPWPGIEQAVTRRSPAWPRGSRPLGPPEALDLADAIRSATVGPAVSSGRLDRGRLVPGQRADLIVVPAEALEGPVIAGGPLGRVRPSLVVVGGEVVTEG